MFTLSLGHDAESAFCKGWAGESLSATRVGSAGREQGKSSTVDTQG